MPGIQSLVNKRSAFKRFLTEFEKWLNSLPDVRTETIITELNERIAKLDIKFDNNESIQEQIYEIDVENYSTHIEQACAIEQNYFKIKSQAKTIADQFRATSNNNRQNSTSSLSNSSLNVKLPTIEMPKFEGEYTKWFTFEDSFNALVHSNPDLNDIQKLCYLRSFLKGEAANTISALETTSDNYLIAYNLLKEKYCHQRLIVYSHVNAILKLKNSNIKEFISITEQHVRSLQSLKVPISEWDAIIIPILLSKLTQQINIDWTTHINTTSTKDKIPTYKSFISFLSERADTYNCTNTSTQFQTNRSNNIHNQLRVVNTKPRVNILAATNICCPVCKQNHTIYSCKQFQTKTVEDRIQYAKQLKLCLNCLRGNHFIKDCTSSSCKYCSKKHNSLLHISSTRNQNYVVNNEPTEPQASSSTNVELSTNCVSSDHDSRELLPTAKVFVYDKFNNKHVARVLLDSGAQTNFISESLFNKLALDKHDSNLSISLATDLVKIVQYCSSVKMKSMISSFNTSLSCLVVPRVASNLPLNSFDVSNINIAQNVVLADPTFNTSQPIDILIKSSILWDTLIGNKVQLTSNLYLINSQLGWLVTGRIPLNCNLSIPIINSVQHNTNTIETQIEKFWSLETIPNKEILLSNENKKIETHFKNTINMNHNGRFIVNIPFNDNVLNKLGNSREIAVKRFLSLERKLEKNYDIKQMYIDFMREYENLSHMTEISSIIKNYDSQYYLPHHHVLRESSTTTKLRVVFDGSNKSDTNISINNAQYVGPTIQSDLFDILIRFRQYRYVAIADIAKMYRQILVEESQRKYQCIVWRENSTDPLKTYQLNTVTYGTASAPYLAIRSLHEVANINKHNFPVEAKIIKQCFYVDDLITGADNINQLNLQCNNISQILSSCGFQLRKWNSNSSDFTMSQTETSGSTVNFDLDNADIKTLGIRFNPGTDFFEYSFNKPDDKNKPTKRSILSATAQIFDPLGLLSPITIIPKMLMQNLWKLKINWDDKLPIEIQQTWFKFIHELHVVGKIQIPRHIINASYVHLELHGFSDASESAYGACLYARSITSDGVIKTELITAKSRVAPLKQISLPRLELCAAVLLSQIVHKILQILDLRTNKIILWTDSQITLAWIKSDPARWKTFVANRVSEIHSNTDPESWYYVKSKENPADIISRGVTPDKLINSSMWWCGPSFLSESDYLLPKSNLSNEQIPETRIRIQAAAVSVNLDLEFLEKFSNLNTLIKVIAYCKRFIVNSLKRDKLSGSLSLQEKELALNHIIKLVQMQSFSLEINLLSKGKSIPTNSKLIKLNPFLDKENILRVGGRISQGQFNYDKKHQILLPQNNKITILIMLTEHIRSFHCGSQQLIYNIRQKYWPIGGKSTARKIVYTCVTCFKSNPRPYREIMGNLPNYRLQPSPPFYFTGTDYAGPITIRDKRSRGYKTIKAYICLFICMSTKAIHIEVVSDLTSEAFVSCLRRFVGRRGTPKKLFSDNGTNFVGANKELKALYKLVKTNQNDFVNTLSNEGKELEWSFIPPRSPHFGGIWESNIKSIKRHLTKVIGNSLLTYEELATILIQIEAILNSRPLSPLSDDPNDLNPITPAHFLIERALTALPDNNYIITPNNRLSSYQHIQKIVQHFWKRWKSEYVSQLQSRSKWTSSNTNQLTVGKLVLLIEPNDPPSQWKLGRISALHPGSDNKVRVVCVKTVTGEFKRAINKICPLPN